MVSKIVVYFTFLVVSALALESQEANSYISYNNHNALQHIQSAPTVVKVAAAAAPVYETHGTSVYASPVVARFALPAEAKYAAPPAYFTPSANPVYSAPSLVSYATPSVATYVNAQASPVYAAPPIAKVATVAYAAPVASYAAAPAYSHQQEEYAHPKYEYGYSVEDHHTGDIHSQQEQRDGDHVVGQYSFHEADGTIRIVKYYDDGHGFNAVVERQGTPTEAPVVYNKVIVPVPAHK